MTRQSIRAVLWYAGHRLRGHRGELSRWIAYCQTCGKVRQRRDPIKDPVWRRMQ